MGNQLQKQAKPIIVYNEQDDDESVDGGKEKTDLEMLEDEIKEMASSMDDMKRELTCSVCHDLYDDPRELPCGHSFFTMMKKRCPLCKVYYHAKDVAQNFQLENIVDAYSRYEKAFKSLKNHRDVFLNKVEPLKLPEIQGAQATTASQQRVNQTPPSVEKTPQNTNPNNITILKTPKRSNNCSNNNNNNGNNNDNSPLLVNININNNNSNSNSNSNHPPTSPVNSRTNKRTKAMRFVQQENDVAHIAQELDTEFLINQAESLLNPNGTLHPKTPKMNQSVHRFSRRNLSVPQL